jgi:hypothetical protein
VDLQLPLRVQEYRPLTPQDAKMILLSRGYGILICLRSPDPTIVRNNTEVATSMGQNRFETGVLDPRSKLLGFHMSGSATHPIS